MIRKIFLVLSVFMFLCVFADDSSLLKSYKIYPKDADNLFMFALNAISSDDKFEISEIQTKNGYILFKNDSKYYLLKVTKRYKSQSEIKILPQNSDFTSGDSVAQTVFSLIDNEIKRPMELIK